MTCIWSPESESRPCSGSGRANGPCGRPSSRPQGRWYVSGGGEQLLRAAGSASGPVACAICTWHFLNAQGLLPRLLQHQCGAAWLQGRAL